MISFLEMGFLYILFLHNFPLNLVSHLNKTNWNAQAQH